MPTNDITIRPWQQEISQPLPVVLGNIDYSEFEKIIKRIDSLLVKSEAQAMYMREYVKKYIDVLIKKTGQDEVLLPHSKQVQLQIEAEMLPALPSIAFKAVCEWQPLDFQHPYSSSRQSNQLILLYLMH